MSFKEIFFYKNKKISKTAIYLSIATFLLLVMWPFQALFHGTELFGFWTVPEFDVTAGVTILFTLSGLYVANHKLKGPDEDITPEQFGELRGQVDSLIESISGKEDAND